MKSSANIEKQASAQQLLISIMGGQLNAWQISPAHSPRSLHIHGEANLLIKSNTNLANALADLLERMRGDGYNPSTIHWVADADGLALCLTQAPSLASSATKLLPAAQQQFLSAEYLGRRLGWVAQAGAASQADWVQKQVSSWLLAADDASERAQLQRARESEHASESERLDAERQQLQQQNYLLREQNSALQQVDTERLLSFLPALYPRVFTVLGASDLAALCGRIEPFNIPNPYPEPSEETLRTLQKQFRALPIAHQREIVKFVAHLPQQQKLQVRKEMRELIEPFLGSQA